MSFNFKRKPLVDKKAAEGVDVRIEKNETYYGTFHVRFIARHLQEVERELNMVRKRRARELNVTKLTDNQNALTLLCDYALLGWSDIEAEDGKPVEFSREAAYEFFDEDYMWIAEELLIVALDSGKFQPVEAFDIAKLVSVLEWQGGFPDGELSQLQYDAENEEGEAQAIALKTLSEAPMIDTLSVFYWNAFLELGSDRPAAMEGLSPIPFTSIIQYADEFEIYGEERSEFRQIIRDVDSAQLKMINEKRRAKAKDQKPSA